MTDSFLTPDTFVLLTGATGGIGWSAAQKIAPSGATLTLVGRDQAKLEAFAAQATSRAALIYTTRTFWPETLTHCADY